MLIIIHILQELHILHNYVSHEHVSKIACVALNEEYNYE